MTKEYEVELSTPISVAIEGQAVEAKMVLLRSPSAKNRNAASKIKRLCTQAITSLAKESDGENKKDATDEETTSSDVINALAASTGTSDDMFEQLFTLFHRLLTNGCGEVEGYKFTGAMFDELDYEDLENLFGEYVKNFLLSSLLMKKDG